MLTGCGRSNEGALQVDFIDTPEGLFANGIRLTPGAQHLRAATDAGLVAFNAQGDVVPALADRWIVTDDGRSFIFRLREGKWPDGAELTAESARAALRRSINALDGTSLGLDLAPVSQVRAMAGRVVEIRLSSPVPALLQILAQPELALSHGQSGDGSGEMRLVRNGDLATLTMKPPAERGIPEEREWQSFVRQIELRPEDPKAAIDRFDRGDVDVVLGGQVGALPLVDTGPLSRGTVRLEPAIGLFGMLVQRERGLLATDQGREAFAMAIDRPALIAPFNIGGWVPTTRISAPGLPNDPGLVAERWGERTIEENRAIAAARVAAWRKANGGEEARLTISLARDPGLDALFYQLTQQLGSVGIILDRAPPGRQADLNLIDRVARYAEQRWFLNQFNCTLRHGLCEAEADALVRDAVKQPDRIERDKLLAEAEVRLMQANIYIPFGSPLRFSLVRSNVEGFVANQWAFHPLPTLAQIPR
ncbi:ABC transporter substrate-binding protein [Altererythrobacter sp. Root672]|uniref:ABC transporter substrate-binding protein n=1 Tax=Altererythrobacter sp. Root672 TaxID=1736584 RepID=UPI001F39E2F1|nr:ABC transporter substrate-binding protein [Altererythrobacter sp. Root672]